MTQQSSLNARQKTYLFSHSLLDQRVIRSVLEPSSSRKIRQSIQSLDAVFRVLQINLNTGIPPPPARLAFNRECRWCTTDDFASSFLHFPLISAAVWDLANSRPVHSLMLSSHLFLCLPCLLPLFTVLCKIVLARPDERET